MSRTRVKICGITRREDALLACALGADAVGVVLAAESPRRIGEDDARAVRETVRGLTTLVALFRNADAPEIEAVLGWLQPDLLQFHGDETPEFCARFGLPFLRALSHERAQAELARFSEARAIIVDSHPPGAAGGTGRSFDWSRFPSDSDTPLLLAGGLSAGNVATAIRLARPYGVDVSSGLESAPGIKDRRLMKTFFDEVRRAGCGE